MDTLLVSPPDASEYAPDYSTYTKRVSGHLFPVLEEELGKTLALLAGIPEQQAGHRYAEGKWSIRQVIGHIIDAERIFAYRALRAARNDQTPLASFEENSYVANARFDELLLADLAMEFQLVRRANIFLFRQFDAGAWDRSVIASGKSVTVRALAWIIAGHEVHHREILRERYL